MKPSTNPRLEIHSVSHSFGTFQAAKDISLTLRQGEFLSFLGPSGCGKSTMLRIIAGFLIPTDGKVLLNGCDITTTPPNRRPVNLVFQRPTLFPHLNVFDNVAFGLRLARLSEPEVKQRVMNMLEITDMGPFADRRSHQLSGGQMQRVALARALVNEPELLLLDEPFSALDIKIRLQMESELRRIHRNYGATIIFVTHDQREAMAMSDRVALFCQGGIEQIAPPEEIYRAPISEYAARFVGDANVLRVDLRPQVPGLGLVGSHKVNVGNLEDPAAASAIMILRPTAIRLDDIVSDGPGLPGVVTDVAYRGTSYSCEVWVEALGEPLRAEISALGGFRIVVGDRVKANWSASEVQMIPA